MNFMPSFLAGGFVAAGILAALGPLVIHLLHRRRYRVLPWAAMDFLREAIRQHRRWLRLRDYLLLALRTLAVLLVGLALARPYWSASEEAFDGGQPLHALMLIDNSLSMSYELLHGTLLDLARERARLYLDRLPAGSRVTVLPTCGWQLGDSVEAVPIERARDLLDEIRCVDRSAGIAPALNLARHACESGPPLARRLVLFSDQQAVNWRDVSGADPFRDLPPLQVVDLSAAETENSWVADFYVQDVVADSAAPALFVVHLRHEGARVREDVQVTLAVDGEDVAAASVTLQPGPGAREVTFPFRFAAPRGDAGLQQVPASIRLSPDRLSGDDSRSLVVPVVTRLPILCVDQYGADGEDPLRNRIGETRPVRRLLAAESRGVAGAALRHVRWDQLDADSLLNTRLVLVAGVPDDGGKTGLLREFVERGGQLVVAAGGEFDPVRWTGTAWREGQGILPAPLQALPLGATPRESAGLLEPFSLDFTSLAAQQPFQLAGMSDEQLRELYAEPLFFKAIRADLSAGDLARQMLDEAKIAADAGTAGKNQVEGAAGTDSATAFSERQPARVLARFDDPEGTPAWVERRVGRGTLAFFATGLLPEWNTLSTTHAVILLDRLLRGLLQSSLPQRNFDTVKRLELPLSPGQQTDRVELLRPGANDQPERLDVGFLGADAAGLTIRDPRDRGIYQVLGYPPVESAAAASEAAGDEEEVAAGAAGAVDSASRGGTLAEGSGAAAAPRPDEPPRRVALWQLPLAVNGPAEESELRTVDRDEFARRFAASGARWVGAGEPISLAGAQVRYQDSWWWILLALLGLLLAELAGLSWLDARQAGRAAAPAGS